MAQVHVHESSNRTFTAIAVMNYKQRKVSSQCHSWSPMTLAIRVTRRGHLLCKRETRVHRKTTRYTSVIRILPYTALISRHPRQPPCSMSLAPGNSRQIHTSSHIIPLHIQPHKNPHTRQEEPIWSKLDTSGYADEGTYMGASQTGEPELMRTVHIGTFASHHD